MKDAKSFRLLLGVIILFSLFFFQGSGTSDGVCTICIQSDFVALKVINMSNMDLFITAGNYTKEEGFERETWLAKGSIVLLTWRVYETLRSLDLKIAAWKANSLGEVDSFYSLKRVTISGVENSLTFR